MNISEEENDFAKRVLESGKPTNDADIITYIETIHSIAKKKTTGFLKKHHVNYQQWRILKAIYLELAITPAKVSAATFTDSGTISRQLELLETKGLVNREHSKQDRRVVNLKLTSKGEHIASDGIKYSEKLIHCVREEIGDDKTEEFHQALVGALKCSAFSSDK
ncbi:MAG: MarR family transcriptional regulator [Gammaproteobacteria bacterium]|nr:MarR family transcriptional regulator [Gammaproteobacteria bacterium]NNC67115.1 MarR family transcriptional regulator [Gammaproteobacteria bacterium]